jgi:hypothetical protein
MKRLITACLVAVGLCAIPAAKAIYRQHKTCGNWEIVPGASWCSGGTMYCPAQRTCRTQFFDDWGLPFATSVTTERGQKPCGSCAPNGGVIGR